MSLLPVGDPFGGGAGERDSCVVDDVRTSSMSVLDPGAAVAANDEVAPTQPFVWSGTVPRATGLHSGVASSSEDAGLRFDPMLNVNVIKPDAPVRESACPAEGGGAVSSSLLAAEGGACRATRGPDREVSRGLLHSSVSGSPHRACGRATRGPDREVSRVLLHSDVRGAPPFAQSREAALCVRGCADEFPALPYSQVPRWIRFMTQNNDAQDPGTLFPLLPSPDSPCLATSVDPPSLPDALDSAPVPKYIRPRAHILQKVASYEERLANQDPSGGTCPSPHPSPHPSLDPSPSPLPVARPTTSRPRPVGAIWIRPSRHTVPPSPPQPACTVTSLSTAPSSPPSVPTLFHSSSARPSATPSPSPAPHSVLPDTPPTPTHVASPSTLPTSLAPVPSFTSSPQTRPSSSLCRPSTCLITSPFARPRTCPFPTHRSPLSLLPYPANRFRSLAHRHPLATLPSLTSPPLRTLPHALRLPPPMPQPCPFPPPDPVPPSNSLPETPSRRRKHRHRGLGDTTIPRTDHGTVRGSWSHSQLVNALSTLCDTPSEPSSRACQDVECTVNYASLGRETRCW